LFADVDYSGGAKCCDQLWPAVVARGGAAVVMLLSAAVFIGSCRSGAMKLRSSDFIVRNTWRPSLTL
jgi:hypothetical protein